MAITTAQTPQGVTVDNNTSMALAFGSNVTNGNLVQVSVVRWAGGDDPIVAGDLTKTAGTSTIGTITLDRVARLEFDPTYWINVAHYSVPVTGTGSLTLTSAGHPSGSYMTMAIKELAGADVSAGRVEAVNSATGTETAPDSGNATSAAGAFFAGVLATAAGSSMTITEDGSWTLIHETENGAANVHSSHIYRIVASGTTDSASWTAPTTEEWVAAIAVYKEAAGAAAGKIQRLALLGAG